MLTTPTYPRAGALPCGICSWQCKALALFSVIVTNDNEIMMMMMMMTMMEWVVITRRCSAKCFLSIISSNSHSNADGQGVWFSPFHRGEHLGRERIRHLTMTQPRYEPRPAVFQCMNLQCTKSALYKAEAFVTADMSPNTLHCFLAVYTWAKSLRALLNFISAMQGMKVAPLSGGFIMENVS